MVAFVGGAGLGLFNSSLAVAGGDAARGNALTGRSGEQVVVNTTSGNLVVQRQDEFLSAAGADLPLVRTYNSQGLLNDDNADNWRMGVARTLGPLTGTLNTAGSTLTRTDGDGIALVYTWDAALAVYKNKDGAGAFDTLAFNAGTSRWTWTDGNSRTTEIYDWANGAGKVLSSTDANGNATTYNYNGSLVTSVLGASGEATYLDYIGNQLQDLRTVRSDGTQTRVRYTYDGAGRLQTYKLYQGGKISDYRYAYNAGDATRTDSISVVRDGVSAITFNNYDQNGFITQVTTSGTANAANARTLTNDVRGRVLKKVQDGHTTYSLIANEEAIGSSSDGAAPVVDTFRSSYVPISSEALAAGPSAYTVQAGETLQSIAKSVWGNANLWYLLADANGKTTVATGEVITIPGKQNTVLNTAQTFAPYNAGQAVGSETPIPAPPKKKSNWFKQLVIIVIAIVATVFTAGAFAAAGAFGAGASATAATAGGLAMSTGASALGATFAAGTAVLGGAAGLAGIGVAAAAAAVGSIASQTAGIVMGMQDDLSWRQVGLSAISAGVTAGVGNLGAANSVVARAVVGNTLTQGIGVVTGMQKSFDWRGVAASALGAGVGQAMAGPMGDAFSQGTFGARLAIGVGAGTAAAVMRGGRIAIQQVATDAFGNALGSSLIEGSSRAKESMLTAGDFARMDGEGYRSLPYDIPNAAGGLGRTSYGMQLTSGAVAAMDEGILDVRGGRVLRATRDSDVDAQAVAERARLQALEQQRSAQVTTAAASLTGSRLADDITRVDLQRLNAAFARRDAAVTAANKFVGPPASLAGSIQTIGTVAYDWKNDSLLGQLTIGVTGNVYGATLGKLVRDDNLSVNPFTGHILSGREEFDARLGLALSFMPGAGEAAPMRETLSVFRKMSVMEAEATIETMRLQAPTAGSNSSKYLSESFEKVQAFQNKAVRGSDQTVVEFVLDKKGYDAMMKSAVNQAGSKGVDAVKINFEGIADGGLRNIGVPLTKLDQFSDLIRHIRSAKLPGQP